MKRMSFEERVPNDIFVQKWNQAKSAKEVGLFFGVSDMTVLRRAKKLGCELEIYLKYRKELHTLKHKKERIEYFYEIQSQRHPEWIKVGDF